MSILNNNPRSVLVSINSWHQHYQKAFEIAQLYVCDSLYKENYTDPHRRALLVV